MEVKTLSMIKSLLGESGDNEVINTIADMVESQLLVRIGEEEVPYELNYIVINVTVARFNQIGDEGKSSMTIEGESASWLTDLFEPYEKDIRAYLDGRDKASNGVKVKFL